jgi:hypothetical protein
MSVNPAISDDPTVARLQIQRYREMTDAQRLGIGLRLWEFSRDLIASAIRSERPDITEVELQRLVAQRMKA